MFLAAWACLLYSSLGQIVTQSDKALRIQAAEGSADTSLRQVALTDEKERGE